MTTHHDSPSGDRPTRDRPTPAERLAIALGTSQLPAEAADDVPAPDLEH